MLAGRPFKVEMGKMCGLSNASALIRYGETCVPVSYTHLSQAACVDITGDLGSFTSGVQELLKFQEVCVVPDDSSELRCV